MAEEKKPDAAPPKPPPGPPAPPPPKNPGFVTATIDGKEVVVKPGMTVIEAAKSVGIDIPYYCYHKRLSVAANCRMCLVEMSNAPGGKLMPACQMTVAEGVAVKTDTAKVKDQQRAVLEFLLLNHPVDCADLRSGRRVQAAGLLHGLRPAAVAARRPQGREGQAGRARAHRHARPGALHPLHAVRPVHAARWPKHPQLGVAQRGNESFITSFPGNPLDDPYAGNVVDICPVGALTSTDFRFRGRVWFMSAAASVCTGCARGCNTFLDYLNDVTYRYRPRENEAVNQEWMCDQGRTSYKYLNADRVLAARAGRGAQARTLPVGAAAQQAAAALAPHAKAGTLAVLLSPVASLEDLLVACAVAKDGLSATQVYVGGRADGWQDDFLKRADENPNRKGLELAAAAYGLAVRPFAESHRRGRGREGEGHLGGRHRNSRRRGGRAARGGRGAGGAELQATPLAAQREPAPAGGAALRDGRHLRELRGAGPALRDGLLPARRVRARTGRSPRRLAPRWGSTCGSRAAAKSSSPSGRSSALPWATSRGRPAVHRQAHGHRAARRRHGGRAPRGEPRPPAVRDHRGLPPCAGSRTS